MVLLGRRLRSLAVLLTMTGGAERPELAANPLPDDPFLSGSDESPPYENDALCACYRITVRSGFLFVVTRP